MMKIESKQVKQSPLKRIVWILTMHAFPTAYKIAFRKTITINCWQSYLGHICSWRGDCLWSVWWKDCQQLGFPSPTEGTASEVFSKGIHQVHCPWLHGTAQHHPDQPKAIKQRALMYKGINLKGTKPLAGLKQYACMSCMQARNV